MQCENCGEWIDYVDLERLENCPHCGANIRLMIERELRAIDESNAVHACDFVEYDDDEDYGA